MKPLVLQSEDFFYWDPEAVCEYPELTEREYAWFGKKAGQQVSTGTQERVKEFFYEIH